MTAPDLPVDSGVLSRYITTAELPGTVVFRLEDLRAILRAPAPAPVGGPAIPAPPPPGGRVAVAPDLPITTADLTKPVLDRLDGQTRQLGAYRDGAYEYEVGAAPVQAYDVSWCKRNAPVAEIVKAYNLYIRLRLPTSPQGNPRLIDLPDIRANLVAGDKTVPYPPRAIDASFEYWLNEVYSETGNDAARQLALRILQNGRAVRGSAALTPDEQVDAMRVLIREAFLVMAPVGPDRHAALLARLGDTADLTGTLGLAYHGTGRAPEAVLKTGTARLLDIDGKAASLGAGNAWHPYSDTHWRGKPPYFRRGSEDNDLPSTVSIAQSPIASLDFPLIQGILNDTPAFHAGGRALADGDYQTTGGYRYQVVGGRYVTHAWVYLVGAETIFPTAELQGPNHFSSPSSEARVERLFAHHGELATQQIMARHHLAAVRYERVHYGPDREQGMRYRAVEIVNLGHRPAIYGLASTYERVYQDLCVRFPMCGVKRGNASAVDYRTRLDEAVGAYDGVTPDSLLAELLAEINEVSRGIEMRHDDPTFLPDAKSRLRALFKLYGDLHTALSDAWQRSVQDMRDARASAV